VLRAVGLTQYRRVTDGRTDGQTDGIAEASTAVAKRRAVKIVHIIETTVSITTNILHSDKDHQMPAAGGPNTRITFPRWRTAAIFEKSKNCHISARVQPIATKFRTLTQFDPLDCSNC